MSLKHNFALLVRYLRPYWHQVIVLALLLLATVGIQVGNPEILRNFIDTAVAGGALPVLLRAAALFLGLGLLNQGLVVFSSYISGNLAWRTTNQMRADLVQHCLHLDMPFHTTHTVGELIERTDEDVSTLSNMFSLFALQILVNLLLLIGVLIVLFHEEWRLGLAMSLYALLCLLVLASTRHMMSSSWKEASQAKAELHGFVGEHVPGVADIRTSGAIAYIMRRFYEIRRNTFLKAWHAHSFDTILSGGIDILVICGTVGAFILGALLFQAGAITLGTVYLVVTYTRLLEVPLHMIMSQIDDLRQASASLARIQELYALPNTVQDGPGANFAEGVLDVQFADVTFAYHPGMPVLKHITFQVQAGEVLGVLGRTGSGKTTLTRLLFRLYDADAGAIRLGGIDIRTAHIAEVRQQIGIVTQDVQLFHASVRDNLTFFDRSIADERLVQVLREVGLSTWYDTLPAGLDTVLANSRGSEAGFSAGEGQLLAFARVFLQNPAVVVLDEASSRLDPATERRIESAVTRLLTGRTGIIIAHRLSTIRRVDKIVILEQGRVREYGTHTELMQDPASHLNRLLQVGIEEVQA